MPDELIVPLSSYDSFGTHHLSITVAYVVRSVDAEAVKAAAGRIIEKWRLLAGRLEIGAAGRLQIRVPLGELDKDQSRVAFTVTKFSAPADPSPPRLHSDSALVLDPPAPHFFRHSSTPVDRPTYIAKKLPLFSIHISQFPACNCVGITFPHGVFDGLGMGLILQALSAELNRVEWTPPPMNTTNIAEAALEIVREKDLSISADIQERTVFDLERDMAPVGVSTVAAMGRNLVYERVWQRSEHHSIYIGGKVCKKLLQSCQQALVELGVKDVHLDITGVLLAWLLKVSLRTTTKMHPC